MSYRIVRGEVVERDEYLAMTADQLRGAIGRANHFVVHNHGNIGGTYFSRYETLSEDDVSDDHRPYFQAAMLDLTADQLREAIDGDGFWIMFRHDHGSYDLFTKADQLLIDTGRGCEGLIEVNAR